MTAVRARGCGSQPWERPSTRGLCRAMYAHKTTYGEAQKSEMRVAWTATQVPTQGPEPSRHRSQCQAHSMQTPSHLIQPHPTS